MSFFKEEKLYRIEITKECQALHTAQLLTASNYLPSIDSAQNGHFGYIPVGIKGWIIRKGKKLYFVVDEDQEGLDLFLPIDQSQVLIPYSKIENCYRRI